MSQWPQARTRTHPLWARLRIYGGGSASGERHDDGKFAAIAWFVQSRSLVGRVPPHGVAQRSIALGPRTTSRVGVERYHPRACGLGHRLHLSPTATNSEFLLPRVLIEAERLPLYYPCTG
jgi:hypothetical protein